MISVLSGQLSPLGAATVQATPYMPASVEGLVLAYDAAVLTGYTDSAPVAVFPDRLGRSGREAVQSVPSDSPTYQASGWPNGKPCVRFSGIGPFFNIPFLPPLLTNGDTEPITGAEMFFVGRKATATPMNQGAAGFYYLTDADIALVPWTDGSIYDGFLGGRQNVGPLSDGDLFTHPFIYNPAQDTAGLAIQFNGAALYTAYSPIATDPAYYAAEPRLGATVSWMRYHGDIAEVLLFRRRLTVEERASVTAYLATKWVVTL